MPNVHFFDLSFSGQIKKINKIKTNGKTNVKSNAGIRIVFGMLIDISLSRFSFARPLNRLLIPPVFIKMKCEEISKKRQARKKPTTRTNCREQNKFRLIACNGFGWEMQKANIYNDKKREYETWKNETRK